MTSDLPQPLLWPESRSPASTRRSLRSTCSRPSPSVQAGSGGQPPTPQAPSRVASPEEKADHHVTLLKAQ